MKPLILIDPDHGIVKLTPSILGGADKILQELADNAHVCVPRALIHRDLPVDLIVRRDSVLCSMPLPALPLSTTFAINGDALTPEFINNRTLIRLAPTWTPPADMKMRVVVEFDTSSRRTYQAKSAQLFVHDSAKKTYRLPLPNHFGDGRLCLGDAWPHSIRDPLLTKALEATLKLVDNSNWNSDQLPNMAQARAMFRFSPADSTTMPPSRTWTGLCQPVETEMVANAMEALS